MCVVSTARADAGGMVSRTAPTSPPCTQQLTALLLSPLSFLALSLFSLFPLTSPSFLPLSSLSFLSLSVISLFPLCILSFPSLCPISTQWLSCSTRHGVDSFIHRLTETVQDITSSRSDEAPLITRERHRELIKTTAEALHRFLHTELGPDIQVLSPLVA